MERQSADSQVIQDTNTKASTTTLERVPMVDSQGTKLPMTESDLQRRKSPLTDVASQQ